MPAIGVVHTEVDKNLAWDAGANLLRLGDSPTKEALRAMHAWVDPDKDPTTKAAYKEPHHDVGSEGKVGAANMSGVHAAMARLNGGLQVPDGDRAGIHAHLAAHYKDAGEDAPELKSLLQIATEMKRYRRETKDFTIELKSVSDDGSFEGYLSVYGIVDLGNDLVEKGAFTRTIQQNNGMVPLLWNHDDGTPLGMLYLTDDDYGLKVKGQMFTNEVPKAAEIHAAAKRYQEAGKPMGMSIGYQATQKEFKEGVRHLKEVKLWEGSLTMFPMLTAAGLTSIKNRRAKEAKDDFQSELEEIQLTWMRYMMSEALDAALCDILWSDGMTPEQRTQASADSIDQFRTTYLEFLPAYLEMLGDSSPYQMMSALKLRREVKAGARNSAADATILKEVIAKLQALLSDESAEPEDDKSALGTSLADAKLSGPAATGHSDIDSLIEESKRAYTPA